MTYRYDAELRRIAPNCAALNCIELHWVPQRRPKNIGEQKISETKKYRRPKNIGDQKISETKKYRRPKNLKSNWEDLKRVTINGYPFLINNLYIFFFSPG